MKVIIHLVIKEFLQIRRDKRILPIIFILPVLQIIILGYAATLDVKNIGLIVLDRDKTNISREFINQFTNSNYFKIITYIENEKEIDYYLDRGIATVAVVIPKNFSSDIISGKQTQLGVLLDGSDANTANISIAYASQIISKYSKNILLTQLKLYPIRAPRISVEPRVWYNPDLRSANFMIPGVIALVLMIITMTLTSVSIVKEKELGTLDQILVTPIKSHQLILGKITPYVMIGFVNVLLVLSIAVTWFQIPIKGSILLLFGLSGLFVMTTLGLGIFISTISKTQQQAMLTAQFFFFFPFIFLSGFTFSIDNFPWIIQKITYLIPLRYFLEIIRGIILKGADLYSLFPQTIALLIFGITILGFSILRFRKVMK